MRSTIRAKEVMKMTASMHNHRLSRKRMKEKRTHFSQQNPYFDYELNKKNPDPKNYETWIKRVVSELKI